MLFPSLVSVIFFDESLTLMRITGIALTVISFTLTVDLKIKEKLSHSWFIFTAAAALTNGGIGITQKFFGASEFADEKRSFVACSYSIAFLIAFTLCFLMRSQKKGSSDIKAVTFIFAVSVGIILAFAFKDNRAFCKYICPVTVFLKPMSYFSLMRISCDSTKCISCGKCKKVCPMEVDMLDNSRSRENGTECILCMQCVDSCPNDALKL